MARKKKRKRAPKFTKSYKFSQQDDFLLSKEEMLQKIHTEIAQELFGKIKNYNLGEWVVKTEGIVLYIDPELGMQAEIQGTSKLPLLKRLTIHIGLLKFLRSGYSILKAVKLCLLTLRTQ